MLVQHQRCKARPATRKENIVSANQGNEEGKAIYKANFQGSRYMAIANYMKENPEGIGENNGAIFLVDNNGMTGYNNVQKGKMPHLTRNRGYTSSKEKKQIRGTNRDTRYISPTEKLIIKGTGPSIEGRSRYVGTPVKSNRVNVVTSSTLMHVTSM